jgi:hypothetical protein
MLEKIDKRVSELTLISKCILIFLLFFLFSCGNSGEVKLKQIGNNGNISTFILWDEPTTNNDGSPLTDIGGYKIYWGINSRAYTNILDIGRPISCGPFPSTICEYPVDFMNGNFYIALTAYDTSGNESDFSNEVYK